MTARLVKRTCSAIRKYYVSVIKNWTAVDVVRTAPVVSFVLLLWGLCVGWELGEWAFSRIF